MKIRSLKDTKGQMRIIETILASFIIVAALSFVGIFAVSPTSPSYEMTDLEKMGYSALHDLDQQGLLAPLVYDQRLSDLRTILRITMPNEVYFNLTICTLSELRLNVSSVSQILYGDSSTFSDAKNIASITYSLTGNPKLNTDRTWETDYEPIILLLELTRG